MSTDITGAITMVVATSFVGTWMVLAFWGFDAFYKKGDLAFKRKWFPRYMILGGLLLAFFPPALIALSSRSPVGLLSCVIFVPVAAVFTYTNIKFTRFCDNCSAIMTGQIWFFARRYCPMCRAELNSAKLDERNEH
jgi:hypothetical protein